MESHKESGSERFDEDYKEILPKLERLIEDSNTVRNAIKENLTEEELARLMTLMRELMPRAIKNLGDIQRFLTKYGYHDDVERI